MSQSPQPGTGAARPVIALRVFRQQLGQTDHVRLLSPTYGGLFTHWIKGRSQYCDPNGCQHGCPKTPQVWKGYAAADVYDVNAKLWMPICLELSEALELDFRGQWERGQIWKISRPIATSCKRVPRFGVMVESHPESCLPQEFNYLPCLLNMYHVFAIDLTFKNPLPPRVLVSAAAGPAPGEKPQAPIVPLADVAAQLKQRAQLLANIGHMPHQASKNGSPRSADTPIA